MALRDDPDPQYNPLQKALLERRAALLEHHHAQPVCVGHASGVGRQFRTKDAEQRALATPVGAEQSQLRPR